MLIERTGGVGGYGYTDIMFIWALVSSAYGFAHVFFGNIRNLGQIIQKGELDLYLLQPKDVYLNLLSSRTIVSAWGDLLYGYVVLFLLPGPSLEKFALFSLLALAGGLIFAATFAAAESLSFFLGNSSAFSSALSEFLLSFSLYPESIHGRATRWLLYSIIPAGFIAFLPLAVWRKLDWGFLPLLYGIALIYCGGSYALFSAGLRRYESGNQMGARV